MKNNNRLVSSACAAALGVLSALQSSLAATVTWGLLNNGFWDVPGNWVDALAPVNNDDVVINVSGLRTVTFRSPTTVQLNSLAITDNVLSVTGGALTVSNAFTHTGSGGIQIAGGVLALNGASTLASLTQSGGTLSGTGTVTVTGAAAFTSGSSPLHTGTGTTVLQSGGTLALFNNAQNLGLDGGRTLRNDGTFTWTVGNLNLNSGALAGSGSFVNSASGTFVVSGNSAGSISASNSGGADTGADALFTNAGTFRKSGATNTTNVSVAFNNTGTVDAQSGILNLNGGGTHTGNFLGTGTIGFGGAHQFNGAISTQNVTFNSGTHAVNGTYNVAGTTSLAGGSTVNLNNSSTTLGALSIANGTLNVNTNTGPLSVGATSMSSGTLNFGVNNATLATLTQSGGTLTGSGTVTVTGAAAFTSGSSPLHTGTGTTVLQSGGTLALFNNAQNLGLDGGRTLRNDGTFTWTVGNLNLNSGALAGSGSFVNSASGTFVVSGNSAGSISASNSGGADTGADALFTNAGTFRKSGATNTTNVSVAFNNTGTVDVQSGILNLSVGPGVAHTGSFTGAGTLGLTGTQQFDGSISTQTVNFSGGTHSVNGIYSAATTLLSANVSFTNPLTTFGALTLDSGGALNLNALNTTIGTLSQSGGTLSGMGTVTVTGAAAFTSGSSPLHTGTGTTVLQSGGTLALFNNAQNLGLDGGRTLRNDGTFTWTVGNLNLNSGALAGSGSFVNSASGTFVVSGNSAGSISASNSGGADTGADALFTNAGTFRKSGATNTTNVSVAFNNTGTVDAQSGILNLNGGGTHTGNFLGTGTIGFGGAHQFNGAISTQNVTFNSGTHAVNGTYNVAGTTSLAGGSTVNLNNSSTTLGALSIANGTLNVNTNTGPLSVGATSMSSGTLNFGVNNATLATLTQSGGTLTGSGTVTVTGAAAFTSGSSPLHTGTGTTVLQSGGTLALFNNAQNLGLDGGRTLRNDGTFTWTVGNLNLNSGALAGSGSFVNSASGTFVVSGNSAGSISASNSGGADTGADALFTNAGTFRKSGATNTTNVSVAFNNTGTVDVQSGILNLSVGPGVAHTGSFTGAGTLGLTGTQQFDGSISTQTVNFSGGTHSVNGIYSAATTLLSANVSFTNPLTTFGALTLDSGGALNLNALNTTIGTLSQSGGTLSGMGTVTVTGAAAFTSGSSPLHTGTGTTVLQSGGTLALFNNAQNLGLDGGRTLRNDGTFTWTVGNLNLNSGALAGSGSFVNSASGTFVVSGNSAGSISASNSGGADTGADALFTNAGTFRKSGATNTTNVSVAFNNTGTVQAQSGILSFTQEITGPTGTVQISPDAAITLGANSTVGTLQHNGSGATSLNLGTRTVVVSTDYNNANFGDGNSFNRRANIGITGTGDRIIAAGDTNQGVSGLGVSSGTSTTPTLVIGNVHVGGHALQYNIDNTGTAGAGPAIRGAVQTTVGGASITDARLTGSGVTAGNFGAVAAGTSLARDVVVNITTAGLYAPISGQAVNIVNNFDNTRSQLLTITSAGGAAAYNLANAAAVTPNPVTLAAQRIGGGERASLTISNNAPLGDFTEKLDASYGVTTGAALHNAGSVGLLAAGLSNSVAMSVGVDTTTAGNKTGSVQLALQSNGLGTSGLGLTTLTSQTVDVSGKVYAPAVAQVNTPLVDFGVVRRGDVVTARAVSVSNVASLTALNDTLVGTLGPATLPGPFTTSGALTGVVAGGTDATSLAVALNTSNAGVFNSHSATATFASHNADMTDLALGLQQVALKAQVNNLAEVSLQKNSGTGTFARNGNSYTLDFGTLAQGAASFASVLGLLNSATGTADFLKGQWDLTSLAPAFLLTGFGSFADIAAGASLGSGLGIELGSAIAGLFESTLTLHASSSYTGLSDAALADTTLILRGQIEGIAVIPEPSSYVLMLLGVALLVARQRVVRLMTRRSGEPGPAGHSC